MQDEAFTVPLPPYFIFEEETILSYTIDKSTMITDLTIPFLEAKTECAQGSLLIYKVNLAAAVTFMTADPIAQTIKINKDAVTAQPSGSYEIYVQVEDLCGLESDSLSITIILQEENEFASKLLKLVEDSEVIRAV